MAEYSVLMSVYAKENPEYLRESIESIWNQTVKTNDFWVVCDGTLTKELDAVLEANREREEELKAQQANNPNGDSKMKTDKVTAVKNMFGNENEGISMGLVVAAGALVGAGAAMFARESYDIASLAGGVAGVGVGYLAGNYLLNGDELTITNYCVGGAVGVGIGAVGALAGGMAGNMVKDVSPVAAVPVTVVSTEQ